MDHKVACKIVAVQEAAMGDEQYRALLAEYRVLDKRLLALLPTLTGEQQKIISDYLGLGGQMHRHLLALACDEDNC